MLTWLKRFFSPRKTHVAIDPTLLALLQEGQVEDEVFPSQLPLEAQQLLPEPTIQLIHVPEQINVFGLCEYNQEANTLRVEVAPWVVSWSIDMAKFTNIVNKGNHLFPGFFTGRLEEDQTRIPACIFFTPSAKQVELGGEISDSWEFARPNRVEQCSSPVLNVTSKYSACNKMPYINRCGGYSPSQPTTIRVANNTQQVPVVKLNRRHFSWRVPMYQVESEYITSAFMPMKDADELFDAVVEHYKDNEHVDLQVTDVQVSNVKPYIETVLSITG